MSGEIAPRKIGRGYARNLNAGPFQPMIGSFDLHLRAEHKSPKTVTVYTDAATWFASAYLVPAGLTDWSQVTARHVQEWVSTLLAGYTDQYASNQFRALQQFFKWHATEDPDEPRRNPMANMKPPKIGGKLVPRHHRWRAVRSAGRGQGQRVREPPRLRGDLAVQGHGRAAV